jgi:hypothetical protein
MSHAVARVVRLVPGVVGGEGDFARWRVVVFGGRGRVLQRKKLRVGGQAGGSSC